MAPIIPAKIPVCHIAPGNGIRCEKTNPSILGITCITGEKTNLSSPGRVGAQSGLGPGPGWGPYGPIGPLWDRSRLIGQKPTYRTETDL